MNESELSESPETEEASTAKILLTAFTRSSWTFEQVRRDGDVAIYKRWKSTSSAPHFEVILVQQNEARTIRDREYPAGESYPPETAWGKKGWTLGTLEEAQAVFEREMERLERKKTMPIDPDDIAPDSVD